MIPTAELIGGLECIRAEEEVEASRVAGVRSAAAVRQEVGNVKMKSPFTPEEHERVDAAIASIKSDSAADLCVVVTHVSDRYPLYPITWASIGAITLGALISVVRPETASRVVIEFQLCFLIVMTLLLD